VQSVTCELTYTHQLPREVWVEGLGFGTSGPRASSTWSCGEIISASCPKKTKMAQATTPVLAQGSQTERAHATQPWLGKQRRLMLPTTFTIIDSEDARRPDPADRLASGPKGSILFLLIFSTERRGVRLCRELLTLKDLKDHAQHGTCLAEFFTEFPELRVVVR
jgi:hypothetical protein